MEFVGCCESAPTKNCFISRIVDKSRNSKLFLDNSNVKLLDRVDDFNLSKKVFHFTMTFV